jgi:hypothetical protein
MEEQKVQFCTDCGYPNQFGSNHCIKCGSRLLSLPQQGIGDQVQPSVQQMPPASSPLPHEQPGRMQENQYHPPPTGKSKQTIIVIAIVVVLIIAATGAVALFATGVLKPNQNQNNPNQNQNVPDTSANKTVFNIESVLPNGTVGEFPDLVMDSNGNPHISYFDYSDHYIKYAFKNGTNWKIESVEYIADENDNMHGDPISSIALDAGNNPHICYEDYHFPSGGFTYAVRTGSGWSTSVIPLPVDPDRPDLGNMLSFQECSIAVDKATGIAHVAMRIAGGGGDALGYWNTTLSKAIIIDKDSLMTGEWRFSTGRHNSIAMDNNGYPGISYFVQTYNGNDSSIPSGIVKYAHWNGLSFSIETIGQMDNIYWMDQLTSLAFDKGNNPHIAFYGITGKLSDNSVKEGYQYAFKTGSTWTVMDIPSLSSYPTLALSLDGAGNPHIVLTNWTGGDLDYVSLKGTTWSFERLTTDGTYCAIVVDSSGKLHIVYDEDSGVGFGSVITYVTSK